SQSQSGHRCAAVYGWLHGGLQRPDKGQHRQRSDTGRKTICPDRHLAGKHGLAGGRRHRLGEKLSAETMQKILETWIISITALLVSFAIVALFIASTGNSPAEVFHSLYRGAFASWFSWQNTLVRAAPLMLTALCLALPARV